MKFHENLSGDMEQTRKWYRRTDRLTDEGHSYNPPYNPLQLQGIQKVASHVDCEMASKYSIMLFVHLGELNILLNL